MKYGNNMHGCCNSVKIKTANEYIYVDTHCFQVKIDYCENCGSVKSTSSIRKTK